MTRNDIMKLAAKRLHEQQRRKAQESHPDGDTGHGGVHKREATNVPYQTPSPFEYTVPSTMNPDKKGFTMGHRLPPRKGIPLSLVILI